MIRINLSIDEHSLPSLHSTLEKMPVRRRASYLRTLLGRLEASIGISPQTPPQTTASPPVRRLGFGKSLVGSLN